jgi:hypothetical protein
MRWLGHTAVCFGVKRNQYKKFRPDNLKRRDYFGLSTHGSIILKCILIIYHMRARAVIVWFSVVSRGEIL